MRSFLTVLCFVVVGTTLSSNAQQVDLRGLAVCDPTTLDTTAWPVASYGRVDFQLPPDFRVDEQSRSFAHGGKSWSSGRRQVTLAMGSWPSISSSTWSGTKCRVDIGKRSVMRIEDAARTPYRVSLLVWDFEIGRGSQFQPLLTAQSDSQNDLPLLRAIASSVYGF